MDRRQDGKVRNRPGKRSGSTLFAIAITLTVIASTTLGEVTGLRTGWGGALAGAGCGLLIASATVLTGFGFSLLAGSLESGANDVSTRSRLARVLQWIVCLLIVSAPFTTSYLTFRFVVRLLS